MKWQKGKYGRVTVIDRNRPVRGVVRDRPMRRGSPPARATARLTSWRKVSGRRARPSPRPRERPTRGSNAVSSSRVMMKIFAGQSARARSLQPPPAKHSQDQRLTAKAPAVALHMVPLWHHKKQCADNHLAIKRWRERRSLYLALTKTAADPIPDYAHLRRLEPRKQTLKLATHC
jgi:hypothetical protein